MSRICCLVEALEQVAEAVDDDLVGDDEHALAAVLARHRVEEAAQAQDHVAPAFAAGRPEIELADVQALLGELGVLGADAERGQPVEDAELLLAQPLVASGRSRRERRRPRPAQHRRACSAASTRSRRLARAHVRRAQHDARAAPRAAALPNQSPSASACRSPRAESGTSTSRSAMSIIARPPASAASRATLPALWPCRTIQSVCGHFCSKGCLSGQSRRLPGEWFMAARLAATAVPAGAARRGVGWRVPVAVTCAPSCLRDHDHERPLLARRPQRPRHRRLARHRPHDRRRLPGRRARAVYISSRKADACDATARELSSLGPCVSLPADVSTCPRASQRSSPPTRSASRRSTSSSTTPAPPGARLSTPFPRRAGTRSST